MTRFLRTPRRWSLPGGINIAWHEPLGVPGSPYLVRWMIECRALGSIRLHHWLGSDDHRAPHDHSWPFATLVLRGRYFDATAEWNDDGSLKEWRETELRAGTLRLRAAGHRHYVRVAHGESCWSLLATGAHQRSFGFWVKRDKRLKANKYFLSHGHHAPAASARVTAKIAEGRSQSIHELHRSKERR